jgi:hypothetical protein
MRLAMGQAILLSMQLPLAVLPSMRQAMLGGLTQGRQRQGGGGWRAARGGDVGE